MDPEILTPAQRATAIAELHQLRRKYPKLDMPEALIQELEVPPTSPKDCIFARTTATISADLQTRITPCQFGGDPDCTQCGCIASMGLAAVGHHRIAGPLTAGQIFMASDRFGKGWKGLRAKFSHKVARRPAGSPFNILAQESAKPRRTPLLRP